MKRFSLTIQIFLSLLFVLVLAIAAFVFYGIFATIKSTQEQVISSSENLAKANAQRTSEGMRQIAKDVLSIATSNSLKPIKNVSNYSELSDNINLALQAQELQKQLNNMVRNQSGIYSVYFVLDDSDYVISSDKGIVPRDNYEPTDWTKDLPLEISVTGVWKPRMLKTLMLGNGKYDTIPVISYAYRLSKLSTATKGIFVVNLKEEQFSQWLGTEVADDKGYFLLDYSGNVMSSPYQIQFLSNVAYLQPIDQILAKNDSSSVLFNSGGKKIIYAYAQIPHENWVYVTYQPIDNLPKDSGKLSKGTVIIIIGCTLLLVLLILGISSFLSHPLRRLTANLKNMPKFKDYSSKNEMKFFESAFGAMEKQEKELNQLLAEREKDSIRFYLHQLLQGNVTDISFSLLDDIFYQENFLVAIVSVDNQGEYNKISEENKAYQRFLFCNNTENYLNEGLVARCINWINGDIAVVCNASEKGMSEEYLAQVFANISESARDIFKQTVTIGISQPIQDISRIEYCKNQATIAVNSRFLLGYGRVFFWSARPLRNAEYYYPEKSSTKIINFLEQRDYLSLHLELGFLENEIKRKNLSADNILFIINQLVGIGLKYSSENSFNTNKAMAAHGNIYSQISSLDTLEKMIQYLEQFYTDLGEVSGDENSPEEDRMIQVQNYLETHYTSDFSFETMAEDIGISYSYLRRLVKETTGKSLIDTVNLLRIEDAKAKLLKTDMNVADIAIQVGYNNSQSLYRFFKKFEGITPSEYRESHANDRL